MGEASTRIHLCGRLVVEIEGERLEGSLPGRQGRLLLAYLALNRDRPVRRDELVEALWPEEGTPSAGEALLRPALSRLRKVLGAERIGGRSEPALLLPAGAWIDWEAAHAALATTRSAVARGEWSSAASEAESALEIADAGLLPGLEADWIEERRRQLADLRVEALEAIALAGVALGGAHLPAAERAARSAVEAAPFRESSRAALMEALRANGNMAEAMRAYEDLRVMLRDELGTTPGPRLVKLHEELLHGEPAPEPVTARAPAPPPPPRHEGRAASGAFVERDSELSRVDALLAGAAERQGRVALIEGPAGIGKTRLLAEARLRAEAQGTRVLVARGSEFERAFPFGAVRQLLEAELADPARRELALAGAAAPAAAVFAAPGDDAAVGAGAPGDASFAALHGLFWLAVNLCRGGPLMLALDDLQWCDRPSLRFAAYLTQRLEGLPILVAATVRSGEPSADEALLGEIAQDPSTVSIRPRPLTLAAVTELVRERLGDDADDTFCATCHRTTVGNPLLVRQLLSALEADGVRPTADNAGIVARIGPGAVSRGVVLRLGRLGDEAAAVARAAAVLGDNAHLPAIAAMADLDEERVAAATGALARSEILRPEAPVGFVHPLVRDAVYHDLPLGERELQHARAARMLAQTGAPAEQIAAHLLAVPARGDDGWAAERLQEAGREAMRKGAADSAATYLKRALDEMPEPAEQRPAVLFELGVAEGLTNGPAAAGHLQAAYAALSDPVARGRVAELLGRTLMFTGSAAEGVAVAREAAAALPPGEDDLRRRLEAFEMISIFFGAGDPKELSRLERYRDPPSPDADLGEKMLAAVAALHWAYTAGPGDRCAELALAALSGGDLIAADNGLLSTSAIFTVAMADLDDTTAAWELSIADAHRRGSLFAASAINLWRGCTAYFRGEMMEAESMLRAALEQFELWGYGEAAMLYARACLCLTLVSRGDLRGAWQQIKAISDPGDTSDAARFYLAARADLLMTERRWDETLEVLDELERRFAWVTNPVIQPLDGIRGIALHGLGRREEAIKLAEQTQVFAVRWGRPTTLGPGLRVLGWMRGGDEGLANVRESVALLEGSLNRLQHAKSLLMLGQMLLERGEAEEARVHLTRALEMGEASGVRPLVDAARAELAKSGVRSSHEPPTGIGALTPTERRVAELAAEGQTEHEIAQVLYETPHAVSGHLDAACRKLGVSDLEQLPLMLVPS